MKVIEIALPALPNFATVGSNKSISNRMALSYAKKRERDKWIRELQAIGYGLRDEEQGPLLKSPVTIHVELVFPDNRLPDYFNCFESVKILVDVLQLSRLHERRGDEWYHTGFAGIIDDDRNIMEGPHNPLNRVVDKDRAPMTVIRLSEGE